MTLPLKFSLCSLPSKHVFNKTMRLSLSILNTLIWSGADLCSVVGGTGTPKNMKYFCFFLSDKVGNIKKWTLRLISMLHSQLRWLEVNARAFRGFYGSGFRSLIGGSFLGSFICFSSQFSSMFFFFPSFVLLLKSCHQLQLIHTYNCNYWFLPCIFSTNKFQSSNQFNDQSYVFGNVKNKVLYVFNIRGSIKI